MLGNDMFFDVSEKQLKNNKKQIEFTLSYLDTTVAWNNNDVTYIIGHNGSGKTLLLNEMRVWCDEKKYTYVFYDAETALSEADWYIDNASDDVIKLSCKKMIEFSYDFNDDINGWAKVLKKDPDDPTLLRYVLGMCGAGYTRIFLMLAKAYSQIEVGYYFLDLPETSLHTLIAGKITDFLMSQFEYTKFVIATNSPEVIKSVRIESGDRNGSDVIEMPFNRKKAS